MVREMDEILRQQVARPAESCMPVDSRGSDDGVSFLDHVIAPLYGVVSAVCSLNILSLLDFREFHFSVLFMITVVVFYLIPHYCFLIEKPTLKNFPNLLRR